MLTPEQIEAKADEYRDLVGLRGKGLVNFWEWCEQQGFSEEDALAIELKLCDISKAKLGNVEDSVVCEREEGWVTDFGICETETFDQSVEKWKKQNDSRLDKLEELRPLQGLPLLDASLVFCHYYLGASMRKLSNAFKISKSQVQSRITVACKKMQGRSNEHL